jgi:hypothetical protein
VGYDISPLKRVKKFNLTLESGEISQLKDNLLLPLFKTNFISKSFGGPLHNSVANILTTCGERHETFSIL